MNNLQYITDESGKRKAVLIPLADWEKHQEEIAKLKRKIEVMAGIQDAVREVKAIQEGKVKGRV